MVYLNEISAHTGRINHPVYAGIRDTLDARHEDLQVAFENSFAQVSTGKAGFPGYSYNLKHGCSLVML